MESRGFDPGAVFVGLVFAVLGVIFLTDALDLATWRYGVVLPAILVALGVSAIIGALWRADRR
jgi:hypothetical protein